MSAHGLPNACIALALGIAAFLLYLPSLQSDFVYDAELQIKYDSWIHTPAHLADVLTFRVFAQDVLDGTRPVHLLSLMTDSLVWHRNPFGYHLMSNLLHALNAALLFLLLTRLAGEATTSRAWLAAGAGTLIFIAHPILTEPVAEVSDREDLLALFFTLAALTLATRFPCANRPRTILCGSACVILLVLAAGSKETGLMSPLLLVLYAWIFRGMKPTRAWGILVGAACVAVGIFTVARFSLQPEVSKIFTEKPGYIGGSLGEVFKIQPRIWAFLFSNAIWPTHLSADYVPQNVAWITLPWALAALALLLAVQAALSLKSRLALFGALMFWLGLAPVSNFLPLFRPIADRFLYMPMAGVAAIVCGGLLLVRNKRLFQLAGAAVLLLSVPLGILTWQRQAVFANSLNLWRDTTAKAPFSQTAADNLGYALLDAHEYSAALASFSRALALTQGKHADAWAGAALTLDRVGRFSESEAALRKAIAIDARYGTPRALVEAVTMDKGTAADIEKIVARMSASSPQ